MSTAVDLIMDLVDGYAENRHTKGAPEYNAMTQMSRKVVEAAVQRLYDMAKEGMWDVESLPRIQPELLERAC